MSIQNEIDERLKELKNAKALLYCNENEEVVIATSENMRHSVLLALLSGGLVELYKQLIGPDVEDVDINDFYNFVDDVAENIKNSVIK